MDKKDDKDKSEPENSDTGNSEQENSDDNKPDKKKSGGGKSTDKKKSPIKSPDKDESDQDNSGEDSSADNKSDSKPDKKKSSGKSDGAKSMDKKKSASKSPEKKKDESDDKDQSDPENNSGDDSSDNKQPDDKKKSKSKSPDKKTDGKSGGKSSDDKKKSAKDQSDDSDTGKSDQGNSDEDKKQPAKKKSPTKSSDSKKSAKDQSDQENSGEDDKPDKKKSSGKSDSKPDDKDKSDDKSDKKKSPSKSEKDKSSGKSDKKSDDKEKDNDKDKDSSEKSPKKGKKGFSDESKPIWIHLLLMILRFYLFIYDVIAYLPFALFANPKKKLEQSARTKAKPLKEGDPTSPWRNVDYFDELATHKFEGCTTVDRLWDRATMFYGNCPCMGTREILNVEQEKQKNGRVFEKLNMGDYKWQTYAEVGERIKNFGSGLSKLGHEPKRNLVIFSDTRSEWLMTAFACFKYGFPLVTVYPTLGEDAIAHAIQETDAETLVATQELIPKVMKALPKVKGFKRLIYIESRTPGTDPVRQGDLKGLPSNAQVHSWKEVEEMGAEKALEPKFQPGTGDIAVIMYTSGTTGLPKGVLMTHGNIVSAAAGLGDKVPGIGFGDVYIGYLPLAHVLELEAELICMSHGVAIGYSSPLTLTDASNKIKRGAKGDCSVLQPTFMATVPTVMDRLYKAVLEKVEHSSTLQRALFSFVYELKRSKIEDGYDTPFLNRLVFSHIRGLLGGRIRIMLSGGAPLNGETQRFMNICFCCPVGQGYGLTETCAAGTCADVTDLQTGRVGAPLGCNDILLREWKEAGYSPKDKKPRGEILISGPNVTLGYLNNDEKTKEDFIEMDGRRWFCTGDIGEIQDDGGLKIIDRKKDLLKLQQGEYISVSRVETTLLTCPLVDNIWVYGNSEESYVVAFVVPNKKALTTFADKQGADSGSYEDMCKNKDLTKAVQTELEKFGKQGKLEKAEVPQKIFLTPEAWSPENGLLTDAMKLKRRPLEEKYKKEIGKLYGKEGKGDDDEKEK